jgi:hypothetical protein
MDAAEQSLTGSPWSEHNAQKKKPGSDYLAPGLKYLGSQGGGNAQSGGSDWVVPGTLGTVRK